MEKILKVSILNYYGRETIKPENELAIGFCKLLKQKTLTRENIESIKALGFEIKTVPKVQEETEL